MTNADNEGRDAGLNYGGDNHPCGGLLPGLQMRFLSDAARDQCGGCDHHTDIGRYRKKVNGKRIVSGGHHLWITPLRNSK